MPRLTHDRPGMTYVCPACDRADVYERTGNGNATKHPERPYRCNQCQTPLHYVVERPKKNQGTTPQKTLAVQSYRKEPMARELGVLSPEDVGLAPFGVRSGQP